MAYNPTNWQDGVVPVDASNLNKLEQAVSDNANVADSLSGLEVLSGFVSRKILAIAVLILMIYINIRILAYIGLTDKRLAGLSRLTITIHLLCFTGFKLPFCITQTKLRLALTLTPDGTIGQATNAC